MSYEKHNFQSGDLIKASDFNEIEDQIAANEENINNKQDKLIAGSNIVIEDNVISAESDVTKNYVDDELLKKQNVLVSGENIKTINGKSLLGNGNITVEGGSSSDGIYELIESTTLSSDATYYTKDKIDLKAIIISITSSSTTEDTAKSGVLSVNGSAFMTTNGLLRKSRTTVFNLYIRGGRLFGYEIYGANNQTNSYTMEASLDMMIGRPCESITTITFYPSGGASILSGTKIDIYGIRN